MLDLFSISAMFILFRETLEACIIVSVMLQLCVKLKLLQLRIWVWAGAIAGVVLAILVGVVFICLYYVAQQTAFQGDGKNIFEGILVLVASFMLTFLAFAMLKIKGYEEKWQAKLEASAAHMKGGRPSGWWQVFLLAFSTTLREGIESVIFLTGVSAGIDPRSIPIAGIVGILLGLAVGIILYYTGKQIKDIAWFMIIMAVLLFFIGAGFTARGMVYFQSAGWFGYYGYPNDARPWQNKQLWDWSGCCSMDVQKNRFFGLVAALFGYTDSGTAIWLFAWFGYWLEVIFVLSVRAIKGSLLSAKQDKGSRGRQSELPLGVKGMPDARSGGDSPTTARANTKAAALEQPMEVHQNGKPAQTELTTTRPEP
ncbi:hypothetical protein CVIRNUC_000861 [Coccomyxa viridis]|uniref:Iron permease FTR1 n=1 Tax=Coccomyxa viridis TaxID=1274662 RepID=A0AAV1HVH8_9CHLO|nr:hypothetical protein CVIRNUC_000861 [Coccomyxa viridis]